MAKVTLQKLTKEYLDPRQKTKVRAVKGIDLEVNSGEFVVLVGPSGCGKSTTLRMIAGLEEISSGTVTIDGRVVNDAPPKDRDIAMVFQNYALYPHMSVFDNMAFALKLRKTPRKEIEERVHRAAKILGIEDYLERTPRALSGGQRQRVAVGRAIVRDPKVFLFDEPLSNLDAKMRVSMRAELTKLHARLGATMIYVTHDQVEAMTMGDRIVVMNDGEIMQYDRPLDLYAHPQNMFVAGFMGSPPMNFIAGTVTRIEGALQFKETGEGDPISLRIPKEWEGLLTESGERKVVLGFRPESIQWLQGEVDSKAPVIWAEVEIAEPMGAETMLHLKTQAHSFIARVNGLVHPAMGERVAIQFDLEQLHFFDPETEKVILKEN